LAQKAARTILMKLTTGVNFINVLRAAFERADHESAKKTDNLIVFFVLLGSVCLKAACKIKLINVDEIDCRWVSAATGFCAFIFYLPGIFVEHSVLGLKEEDQVSIFTATVPKS